MVSIHTNDNNPQILKLDIAVSNNTRNLEKKISIVKCNQNAEFFLIPYITVGNNTNILTPNSAVWYLIQTQESAIAQVNEWLEWESVTLCSLLSNVIGGVSKNDKLKDNLSKHLKKLDSALNNKLYLTDTPTIADISIFATIAPLIIDENLNKQYLSDNHNIISWFNNLSQHNWFKDPLGRFKESFSTGQAGYSALLAGGKYAAAMPISSPTSSPQHQPDMATLEELKYAAEAWKESSSIQVKQGRKPVMPRKGERNILITSALPYVNNVPHLGNIIGCVLSGDVFARFCRLCNYNTLYIGGTDEYGTATETKALEEGLSCQAICDKYYKIHNEIYKWFKISFDHFGRSSSPHQTEIVQSFFLQLNQNGFLFTQSVDQLHCEKCNRFLADRFVEGGCPNVGCTYEDARGDQCDGCGKLVNAIELKNPRCKICGNTPKLKTSTQFFMDLPRLEPLLLHWMKTSAPGWSSNAQMIARSWLREGLKPRCITRDLKWGVPVPLDGFRDKVFYVWFDAPLGYMSITKDYTDQWQNWWKPEKDIEVSLYQFIGKDNVPFHSIMFPATLLGINKGYTTVSSIMATEYLNYEDGKFSKSRGVGVFGNDAQTTGIPSDVFRFYLLYVRPESQDSSFSWVDFATKNNSELLNNLGNFINRALVFAKNNFNKIIPEMSPTKDDYQLLALCNREYKGYVACLEKAKLRDGIRHILSISRHGNQYMQSNQPWVLLKGSDAEKTRAGTVIGISCNIACLLTILLHPYMPDTSLNLKNQLNAKDFAINPSNPVITCLLPPGHKLGEPSPLFAKIEPAKVEELKKKFAGKQNGTGSENHVDASKQKSKPNKGQEQGQITSVNGIGKANPVDVKALQEAVDKQGGVVRKLKEGGADKAVWQPEVVKLLALKAELAAATGVPIATNQSNKKKK